MVHDRKLNFDIIGFMSMGTSRDGEDRGEGVVLLRAEGPPEQQRRTAQPGDGVWDLEGNRVRPANPESSRAPGAKTDWVMNEYRLPESSTGGASDIPVKGGHSAVQGVQKSHISEGTGAESQTGGREGLTSPHK